jgi:hypothetical protein
VPVEVSNKDQIKLPCAAVEPQMRQLPKLRVPLVAGIRPCELKPVLNGSVPTRANGGAICVPTPVNDSITDESEASLTKEMPPEEVPDVGGAKVTV